MFRPLHNHITNVTGSFSTPSSDVARCHYALHMHMHMHMHMYYDILHMPTNGFIRLLRCGMGGEAVLHKSAFVFSFHFPP